MKRSYLASAALVAFCLLLAAAYGWTPIGDLDVWYHLAAGRWMAQHHAVYLHDAWSFTVPGGRLNSHEWLFQLVLYLVWAAGGYTAMAAFKTALIAATLLALARLGRIIGAPRMVHLPLLALASWAAVSRFMDRPHMATLLFSALTLMGLEQAFRSASPAQFRRRIWWLIPVFWIWGQSHAGIIYGYGMLGAYGLDLLLRSRDENPAPVPTPRFLLFSLVCVAASIAGPNHIHTPLYPLEVLPKNRQAGLQMVEFTAGSNSTGMRILGLIVAGIALAWLLQVRRRPLREVFVAAGLGVVAWSWTRERGYYLLLMSPFVADALAKAWSSLAGRVSFSAPVQRTSALILCGALWVPSASLAVQAMGRNSLVITRFRMLSLLPEGAVDFHRRHALPVRAFHRDNLGGYLVWKSGERIKTFVDARMELWPKELLIDYRQIIQGGQRSLDLLRRWNAETAFLEYAERFGEAHTLQDTFWSSPEWGLVYWDDAGMLYVRNDSLKQKPELRRWTAVNPDDLTLSAPLASANQTSAALAELQEVAALAPEALRPRRLMGHLLLKTGRPQDAAREFLAITKRAGARGDDFHALAYALDSQGRSDEALLAVRAGLAAEPGHAALLDLGGILLAQAGQLSEAVSWLEQANQSGPPSREREMNLARMLQQLGEKERAERHAASARELGGGNP